MNDSGIVTLYHGTDVESALTILNQGLNEQALEFWQTGRKLQSGTGWYATDNTAAAHYFATLAPGNNGQGNTIIAMEVYFEHLELLLEQGLAKKEPIRNVYFDAKQYWFSTKALRFLNEQAVFRPHLGEEE